MKLGAIEAGGTKWVCAVGTGPDDVRDSVVFATGQPGETIEHALEFLTRNGPLDAVGIGSFGPVDLRAASPTWGRITTTPKDGWRNTDLGAAVASALGVPVAFDTDVNAAALAENRGGAQRPGVDTFAYMTVGTGIGGGAMVDGRLLHGLLGIPRSDTCASRTTAHAIPSAASVPTTETASKGLRPERPPSSGGRRWPPTPGMSRCSSSKPSILALGLTNLICTLSPQRLILGGGVMKQPTLLARIRTHVQGFAAGYLDAPELGEQIAGYIVPPALGDMAGVLGALELARLNLE